MTAIGVATWRVTPGQYMKFFENVGVAKNLHTRHGLGVSVWNAVYAGANSLTFVYATVAEDLASHAAKMQAATADPEWLAFWDGALNSDPPSAALLTNGLSVDIPGFASDAPTPNTSGTPRALEAFFWGPQTPDQQAAMVTLLEQLAPVVHERGGSIAARLSVVGGVTGPGVTMTIVSPSLAAWGEGRQAAFTNPAVQSAVAAAGAVLGPPVNSLLGEILL